MIPANRIRISIEIEDTNKTDIMGADQVEMDLRAFRIIDKSKPLLVEMLDAIYFGARKDLEAQGGRVDDQT